jgi:hypothetical protein
MTAGNEINLHILVDHGSGSKLLTMRIRLRLERGDDAAIAKEGHEKRAVGCDLGNRPTGKTKRGRGERPSVEE